jgi:hypothetical protein
MAVDFYGKWLVQVVSKDAAFDQRLVVSGAVSGDGVYPGVAGTTIQAEGPHWALAFEWNDNAGSGWQPSDSKKIDAAYPFDRGLVVTVGVDDNRPELRDHDYNDVVVSCRSLDPALNPWIPIVNNLDFTTLLIP